MKPDLYTLYKGASMSQTKTIRIALEKRGNSAEAGTVRRVGIHMKKGTGRL